MKDLKEYRANQWLKRQKSLEFWCHFMPSENMVKQAISQYLRKNFACQLVVHKGRHNDLNEFKSHVISFTDIRTVPHGRGLGNALTWILPVYQRIVKVAYASPQFARKTLEATSGRILKDSQISKVYTTSHEMSHTWVQSTKAMSKLRLLTY